MDPFMVASGIGAVGSLFKGLTSLFAGNNQAAAFRNAALEANQQGGVNAQVALEQGDAQAAHGAVAAAAGGGGFMGATLGAISRISSNAMFNARSAVYRGQTEAQRDDYQAQVASAQGLSGLVGGVIGAGGSLAGGMMRSSASASMLQSMSALRGDPSAAYMASW